jgi:glycosyltransferase involved in cell wall biosynthesis
LIKHSVCHLTNVHHLLDQRIFYKEAQSLAAAGYDVTILGPGVASLSGDHAGVRVVTISPPTSVVGRLMNLPRLFRAALHTDARLIHFHDPELLLVGLALRMMGRKVVYDCHENFPQTAYVRRWVPALLRRPLAMVIDTLERTVARLLSGVLGVVDEQGSRFDRCPFVAIKNFPRLEWFSPNGHGPSSDLAVCELLHIGSLSHDRGSQFLLDVMSELGKTHPDVKLRTVGAFHTEADRVAFEQRAAELGIRDRIDCCTEKVPYDELGMLIRRHRIGLIPGQVSVKNLSPFIPTKLFEYLACGLPVVASSLPSIRGFYAEGDWGVLADPSRPCEHAAAIRHLLDDEHEALAKGRRGRSLVERRFNWSIEAERLIDFYKQVS